ncbi:MAG: FAD-dependent oxidoreductase [Prolixibacteraceae bacterium]|jgi:NADPH-dependent 2,4-dienoyl-CoA reductase/sulfur reductase-like enzyme/rhodanese-related sulfurtransferase|nr:FAD-dependent oxidoreductase [Prolixibacteraceae bacterium]
MNEPTRIVIIGGSAAGPKAASKARRLNEFAEITIIQKDADLSMASCGYPYYVGGFFDNRNQLLSTPTGVVRDQKFYLNAKGIKALVNTEALKINTSARVVETVNLITGEKAKIPYDKLILATGATPNIPPLEGVDLEGITTLQSMKDADYLRKVRDDKKIKKAVVIGGGLIGIETAEALRLADIEITIVELLPQLLTFLDFNMAKLAENYVKSKTNVITKNGVAKFIGENGKLVGVKLQNGTEVPCELAVIAIGVRPDVKLAKAAGIKIGEHGGIEINEFMQTSNPDIYAVGDCVEITNLVTGRKVLAPYGDLANLEGRVAGENAVLGNSVTFKGTIQTGICKVFDYNVGATGLSEDTANKLGIKVDTIINASPDKPGFMIGKLLISKLIVNAETCQILGAQCIGPGDVCKQISIWAMAIMAKMCIEDMVNADFPYAPPFSLAIDHSIATAHIMQNKRKGRFVGITAQNLKKKMDDGDDIFLLDTRGYDEFEVMRLGKGETLIPLGQLRTRMNELPEDKSKEIITYCKISLRGYEAAVLLKAHGYTNVKVLEGGLMAWHYKREK